MDSFDFETGSTDPERFVEPSSLFIGIILTACVFGLIAALAAISSGAPWWSALALYSGVGSLATLLIAFFGTNPAKDSSRACRRGAGRQAPSPTPRLQDHELARGSRDGEAASVL